MDKLEEWMNKTLGGASSRPVGGDQPNQNQTSYQIRKPARPPNRGTVPSQNAVNNAGNRHNYNKNSNRQFSRPATRPQSEELSRNPHGPQSAQGPQNLRGSQSTRGPQRPQPPRGPQPTRRPQPPRGPQPPRRPQAPSPKPSKVTPILRGKLKIIPFGGLDEVGKNMMAFEYENDIIIVDMGLEFPSDDLFGIDYVIPDVSYLEENKHRIKAVFITHGHLDHIGGIPYILPKLNFPPIFATKLTNGLIQKKIEEFKLEKFTKLNTVNSDDVIRMGNFQISFFRVTHSIPDCIAIVVTTPVGRFVVTGDYKFDETTTSPFQQAEIGKMEQLGKMGVTALLGDSTNSLKPGHSLSETDVFKGFEEVIQNVNGRLIIATFASQIGRLQQILDLAVKFNRKVFISGRSMRDNVDISTSLGYLKAPKGLISDIKRYNNKSPDQETLIITTGSQGESVSALSRIATNDHPHIQIKKGDTIVLSSSPIVGNERAIYTMINNLAQRGAEVVHSQLKEVHSSGHGYQEEIKRMINLIRPKYLIPVHGEYYMRQAHGKLAVEECGIPREKVIMIQNGDVLIADQEGVRISPDKVETKYILIDGSGEGQIGSFVQTDREIMSQNGVVIILIKIGKNKKLIREPDIITRGFIYMHETEEITAEIAKKSAEAYRMITTKNKGADRKDIKKYIRQTVDKYTHRSLSRSPLIIPLIVEG